jgi:hypothetical protein
MIETKSNWCSTVDSPTYKLTWYIVSNKVFNNPKLLDNLPDKYNATDNMAVSKSEAVVIAASGETSEYSLENLVLQSRISPGSSTGNTTTGAFQFDIYEPGGFLLMNRILSLSHAFNFGNIQSAKYVLKVQFVGRTVESSTPIAFPGTFYYPMMLSTINASSGPEGSQYNIVAANVHKIAVAASKIVTDIKVTNVKNVQSLLDNLETALNAHEKNIRKLQVTESDLVNSKYWKIKVDPTFEKYLSKYVKPSQVDMPGTGHKASGWTADSAQYILHKNQNVVTYLTNILTKQVPEFYNNFQATGSANKKNTGEINNTLSGEGNRASEISATYSNEFIKITPSVNYTDEIDPYTNTNQEEVVLTIALHTSHTNPQTDVKKQQEATIKASYQSRRFELLPIYKAYNFLFSGSNSEVLDFNLNFNQMFYLTRDPSEGVNLPNSDNENAGNAGAVTKVTKTVYVPKYLSNTTISSATAITQLENIAYVIKVPESTSQSNADEPNAVVAVDQAEINAASHDFIMFDITIKGDPYWLGTPGSSVTAAKGSTLIDSLDEDSLIIFINYLPDNGKTNGERRLDIASSGVYKILEVESKFQLGKFTQSLKGMRDRNSSTDLIKTKLLQIGRQNGN